MEFAPSHAFAEAVIYYALVKRVLIDDDKSVVALRYDEAVVYLQKLPAILSGVLTRQLARPAAGGRAKADLLLPLDGSVFLKELSHCIGDSFVPHRIRAPKAVFHMLDIRELRLGLDVCPQEFFTENTKNL